MQILPVKEASKDEPKSGAKLVPKQTEGNTGLSLVKTLKHAAGSHLSFSQDGKSVWTRSGGIRQLDIGDGTVKRTLRDDKLGTLVGLAADGQFGLFRGAELEWIRLSEAKSELVWKGPRASAAAISSDGRRAAALKPGGALSYYDLVDGAIRETKTARTEHGSSTHAIALHPKDPDLVLLGTRVHNRVGIEIVPVHRAWVHLFDGAKENAAGSFIAGGSAWGTPPSGISRAT